MAAMNRPRSAAVLPIEFDPSATLNGVVVQKFQGPPKGQKLVVTTTQAVFSWDMVGVVELFRSNSGGIKASKYLSDPQHSLAVADDSIVVLHDVNKSVLRTHRLKGSEGQIRLIRYAASEQNLYYTTTLQNSVQSFSLRESKLQKCCDSHPSPPSVFALSCDSRLLLSTSTGPPCIQLQDLTKPYGPTIIQPKCSNAAVVAVDFHPETAETFVMAFADGSVAIYDARRLLAPKEYTMNHNDGWISGEIASVSALHAPAVKTRQTQMSPAERVRPGTWTELVLRSVASITAIALVPGHKATAITTGSDRRCCVVDFTQPSKSKAVLMASWKMSRPATSLSVIMTGLEKSQSPHLDGTISENPSKMNHCIAVGRPDGKVLLFDLNGRSLGQQLFDQGQAKIIGVEWSNEISHRSGPRVKRASKAPSMQTNAKRHSVQEAHDRHAGHRKSFVQKNRESLFDFVSPLRKPQGQRAMTRDARQPRKIFPKGFEKVEPSQPAQKIDDSKETLQPVTYVPSPPSLQRRDRTKRSNMTPCRSDSASKRSHRKHSNTESYRYAQLAEERRARKRDSVLISRESKRNWQPNHALSKTDTANQAEKGNKNAGSIRTPRRRFSRKVPLPRTRAVISISTRSTVSRSSSSIQISPRVSSIFRDKVDHDTERSAIRTLCDQNEPGNSDGNKFIGDVKKDLLPSQSSNDTVISWTPAALKTNFSQLSEAPTYLLRPPLVPLSPLKLRPRSSIPTNDAPENAIETTIKSNDFANQQTKKAVDYKPAGTVVATSTTHATTIERRSSDQAREQVQTSAGGSLDLHKMSINEQRSDQDPSPAIRLEIGQQQPIKAPTSARNHEHLKSREHIVVTDAGEQLDSMSKRSASNACLDIACAGSKEMLTAVLCEVRSARNEMRQLLREQNRSLLCPLHSCSCVSPRYREIGTQVGLPALRRPLVPGDITHKEAACQTMPWHDLDASDEWLTEIIEYGIPARNDHSRACGESQRPTRGPAAWH